MTALLKKDDTKNEVPDVYPSITMSCTSQDDEDNNNNEEMSSLHSPASVLTVKQREEIVFLLEQHRLKHAHSDTSTTPEGNLLPKDAFSFLAYGGKGMRGPAFYLGLLTFLIQLMTLTIVMMDQLFGSEQTPENRLGVPPFVTWPVRASQFIAILISVMMQMDVIWSVNVFYRGFKRQAFQKVLEYEGKTMPESLPFWWHVSAWSRLLVGLFCLVVMFMLIVKSETGRAVLLSFNAVNFIGGLDNAVFAMAEWDYFGKKVKASADSPLIGDMDQAGVASSLQVKRTNGKLKKNKS